MPPWCKINDARRCLHGNKLHHLYGLAYHHYSPLQFGALLACSSIAAALLGLAAGLHEAEAGAAGTLEQELHVSIASSIFFSAVTYLDLCISLASFFLLPHEPPPPTS